ncbi:MAG: hypothetical protein J7J92_03200 [Candidatus Aenigmarchaeota archaeon]|nr:hypothetical protein [Candidatus Aenigmarchaeota archaeon]
MFFLIEKKRSLNKKNTSIEPEIIKAIIHLLKAQSDINNRLSKLEKMVRVNRKDEDDELLSSLRNF